MKAVFVAMLKRALVLVAVLCLGCAAQNNNNSAEVNRRIERQVRHAAEVSATADVTVGERKASAFGGWDEITVLVNDQGTPKTYTFLLSKDGKSLVHYQKFDISTDPNQRAMAGIDLAGRPVRGNKDAKVTAVVYDDFQCPYCARMYDTLFTDVMKTYGDRVKVVYKDYPLFQIHPWAVRASVNANCLLAQSNEAFWQFSDKVHANQSEIGQQESAAAKETKAAPAKDAKGAKPAKDEKADHKVRSTGLDKLAADVAAQNKLDTAKLNACLEKHDTGPVGVSLAEAKKLGVSATPTLFINGERLEGAASAEELKAVLDRALRDAGQAPPQAPPPAQPKAQPKPGDAK
ncbi:MAG: DsbA family protein [Acidobacteriota bacterium]|nr:DsbA family protein [Acidobacteriota bacterium]